MKYPIIIATTLFLLTLIHKVFRRNGIKRGKSLLEKLEKYSANSEKLRRLMPEIKQYCFTVKINAYGSCHPEPNIENKEVQKTVANQINEAIGRYCVSSRYLFPFYSEKSYSKFLNSVIEIVINTVISTIGAILSKIAITYIEKLLR